MPSLGGPPVKIEADTQHSEYVEMSSHTYAVPPNAPPVKPDPAHRDMIPPMLPTNIAIEKCLERLGVQQFCHAPQKDFEKCLNGFFSQNFITKNQVMQLYTRWLADWIPYENYLNAQSSSPLVRQWCHFIGNLGIPKVDVLNCFADRKEYIINLSTGNETARKRKYNLARRDIEMHLKIKKPGSNAQDSQAKDADIATAPKGPKSTSACTKPQTQGKRRDAKTKPQAEATLKLDLKSKPLDSPMDPKHIIQQDHAPQTIPGPASIPSQPIKVEEKTAELPEWRKRANTEPPLPRRGPSSRKKRRTNAEAAKGVDLNSLATQETPADYVCKRCDKKGHWLQLCPTNNDPSFDPKPAKNYKCILCKATGEHMMTACQLNKDPDSLNMQRKQGLAGFSPNNGQSVEGKLQIPSSLPASIPQRTLPAVPSSKLLPNKPNTEKKPRVEYYRPPAQRREAPRIDRWVPPKPSSPPRAPRNYTNKGPEAKETEDQMSSGRLTPWFYDIPSPPANKSPVPPRRPASPNHSPSEEIYGGMATSPSEHNTMSGGLFITMLKTAHPEIQQPTTPGLPQTPLAKKELGTPAPQMEPTLMETERERAAELERAGREADAFFERAQNQWGEGSVSVKEKRDPPAGKRESETELERAKREADAFFKRAQKQWGTDIVEEERDPWAVEGEREQGFEEFEPEGGHDVKDEDIVMNEDVIKIEDMIKNGDIMDYIMKKDNIKKNDNIMKSDGIMKNDTVTKNDGVIQESATNNEYVVKEDDNIEDEEHGNDEPGGQDDNDDGGYETVTVMENRRRRSSALDLWGRTEN